MKQALIIGGSGFLGSHVADSLSDSGIKVSIFDRTPSKWLRDDQIMITGDILDLDALCAAIHNKDYVYNFAAVSDLNEAIHQPIKTANINIVGNLNALEACRINKVERFIYASSLYVYSREGGFYKCSKQSSEHFVEEYKKTYDLDYSILRYGTLYGPRSDESNGVYRIIKSALEDNEISYKGDVESMREYIHVLDAAYASVKILDNEYKNQSIILTGHELLKVSDFLSILAEILNYSKKQISFENERYTSHYIRTPYAYQPKFGKKFIPSSHIDLGQGLIQLISEIDLSNKNA